MLNSILKGIYFYLQHKSVWNESIRTHSSSVISQLTIPQLKEISSTNHEKSEVEMEVDNPRRDRKRIRGSFSVGPSVTSIDILSNSQSMSEKQWPQPVLLLKDKEHPI